MRTSMVCAQRCFLSNKEDVQSVYQQPKPHALHTSTRKRWSGLRVTFLLGFYHPMKRSVWSPKCSSASVRSAYVSLQQPHTARTPTCARRTNQTLPPVSVHHYKHLSVTGKGSTSWVVQGPELWTVLWIQRSLLDIHKKDKDIKKGCFADTSVVGYCAANWQLWQWWHIDRDSSGTLAAPLLCRLRGGAGEFFFGASSREI